MKAPVQGGHLRGPRRTFGEFVGSCTPRPIWRISETSGTGEDGIFVKIPRGKILPNYLQYRQLGSLTSERVPGAET